MSRRDNHAAVLDSIEAYARILRNELPATITHLEWLMPDGLAAHPYDTANGHSLESPVERCVLKRQPGNITLNDLGDELDAAARTLRNLLRDCRTARKLGHTIEPTDGEPTRCDGGAGREGFLIPRDQGGWARPDCTEIPDAGRRTCERCRKAAQRWTPPVPMSPNDETPADDPQITPL